MTDGEHGAGHLTPQPFPISSPAVSARSAGKHRATGLNAPAISASGKISALFDEAFDLYKQNFAPLALITALLLLPTLVICEAIGTFWIKPLLALLNNGFSMNTTLSFEVFTGVILVGMPKYGVPGLFTLAVLVGAAAPVSIATSDVIWNRPIRLASALHYGLRRLPQLLVFITLAALSLIGVASLVGIVLILALLIVALVAPHMPDALGALALFLIVAIPIVAGCAVTGRWFLCAIPLIVIERQPLLRLAARNDTICYGIPFSKRWAIALFLPLSLIGIQILASSAMTTLISTLPLGSALQFAGYALTITAIAVLFQPYWMVFLTYLYWSQRIRAEAVDLVEATQADAPYVTRAASAPAYAPQVPPLSMPTRKPQPPPSVPPLPSATPPASPEPPSLTDHEEQP
jgi:hypothetical protein